MWCTVVLLFILVVQAACTPLSNDKGVVLFTCPPDSMCYASPRNCLDNCNAAFSMRSNGNVSTTFNITMMSPLSYTAVLVKQQEDDKFRTAVICSFHTPKGIVATVDFPHPIVVLGLIDATEPEGRTDSTHTQCSTTIYNPPPPIGSKFKLISGKWQSVLIIDENLAVDVVPAIENARILSTNEKLIIPSPKVPVFRASESEDVNSGMISESFAQRQQFESRMKPAVENPEESSGKVEHAESTENISNDGISPVNEESSKISEKNVSEQEEDVTTENMNNRGKAEQHHGEKDRSREENLNRSNEIGAEDSKNTNGGHPRFRTHGSENYSNTRMGTFEDDDDIANEYSVQTTVVVALSLFSYLYIM